MKIDLERGKNAEDLVDVLLGINFGGTEKKEFKIGSVWYELKHGSLRIKLKDATAPYNLRCLDGRIDARYESKREVEVVHDEKQVDEKSASRGLKLGVDSKGLKSNASIADALKRATQHGERQKVKEAFDHTYWSVTTKGSEEEPIWDFWPKGGSQSLLGYIKENLCTIHPTTKPCCLDATFEVSSRDISIVDVSGLWPESCTQNKRKVIKRIAVWAAARDLSPFISRHQVRYE